MKSLLTLNNLGYARDVSGGPECNRELGVFIFASENSLKVRTYFYLKNQSEKQIVIGMLVEGRSGSKNLNQGQLSFKFDDGHVELSWVNREGLQTATFDEIALVQLMEVEWVRTLVKNRTDGYL